MGEEQIQANKKIIFGIIGSGWRSEFYLRIAQAMPEKFGICGLVSRSEETRRKISDRWHIHTYDSLDGMLRENPEFVVVSVQRLAAPDYIIQCAERQVPVLTETPPAAGLEDMKKLYEILRKQKARVQVAEQYHLQPMLSAAISMAGSGKLGTVSQVQLSFCHGYHGVSMIRKLLKMGFENARISARRYAFPLVEGPGRDGGPNQEEISQSRQMIAHLEFDGKLGIYDFSDDQYFSWVRSKHLLVRGEKGEISDDCVRYLKDYRTPVEMMLRRINAGENGNLEGYYLKGILAGDEWIYQNPFIELRPRLTDDELAIAACLQKMDEYVCGGPSFYSVEEAMQDHYLSLMMDQAADMGNVVDTQTQPWAE